MKHIKTKRRIPSFRRVVAVLFGTFALECTIIFAQSISSGDFVAMITTATVAGLAAWVHGACGIDPTITPYRLAQPDWYGVIIL